MTEKERMLSGKLYMPNNGELKEEFLKARMLTRLFNQSNEDQLDYRSNILKELFKSSGSDIYIEPSFRCDYGSNISIGNNFYANFDCIILDVCSVDIGDNVMFGPRVCIYTASHPIDANVRTSGLEYGAPVKIGNKVWIGGNTVINPNVSIGDNTIIGAGSVVTKNIPAGVIAAGNPCKVIRYITDNDKDYWEGLMNNYKTECE